MRGKYNNKEITIAKKSEFFLKKNIIYVNVHSIHVYSIFALPSTKRTKKNQELA